MRSLNTPTRCLDRLAVAEWLLDDPLPLAVGQARPLALAPSITPGELEHEAWVIGSADSSEGLLGAWVTDDWAPRVAFTARDWTAKLGLVAQGLGVTVEPRLAARAVPKDIVLVRIAPTHEPTAPYWSPAPLTPPQGIPPKTPMTALRGPESVLTTT